MLLKSRYNYLVESLVEVGTTPSKAYRLQLNFMPWRASMLETIKPTMPVLIEDLGIRTSKSGDRRRYGKYHCECGNTFEAQSTNVKRGLTASCGCYAKRISLSLPVTHGLSNHVLYKTWVGMKNRCESAKFEGYHGRGITVCDRWLNVENFINDMFPTYKDGLTLDRRDNDGNYEPSNCRWATNKTQGRNKRVIMSTNNSGYRGVCFNKNRNTWASSIGIDYKSKHIGVFGTALEAAIAYDTYVIEHNLEHTINGVLHELLR